MCNRNYTLYTFKNHDKIKDSFYPFNVSSKVGSGIYATVAI